MIIAELVPNAACITFISLDISVNMRFTTEQLIEAVKQSISYSGVIKFLGFKVSSNNFQTIKKKVASLALDISHFKKVCIIKEKISRKKKTY